MLFPVAFELFALPSVIVNAVLKALPVGTTSAPVKAHPFPPLPPLPVSAPGTPAPAYCVVPSTHPLSVLALSIAVPGLAIHNPVIPVELFKVISKLATVARLKANVSY